jgi:uroporphyrinogen-III synthase
MRLLVTRPAEDAAGLIALLAGKGHEVTGAPIMEIRLIADAALDLSGVEAVLITSRNGLRALAAATPRRDLPLLAVGPASAAAAREAGFAEVLSAEGDVAALAALVAARLKPAHGTLLHVAGTVTAGDLAGPLSARGFPLRRAVLYEAAAAARLPGPARDFLTANRPGGVLLYSPRSAALFRRLVTEAGLAPALGSLTAFCLSEAVAAEARALPFGAVAVAPRPEQDSVLALIPA